MSVVSRHNEKNSIFVRTFKVVSQDGCDNPTVAPTVHFQPFFVELSSPSNIPLKYRGRPLSPSFSLPQQRRSPPSPLDCQNRIFKSILVKICLDCQNVCLRPSILRQFIQIIHSPVASPVGCTPQQGGAGVLHDRIRAFLGNRFSSLHLFLDAQGSSHQSQTLPPILFPGHGDVHHSRDLVWHLPRPSQVFSVYPFIVQEFHRHPPSVPDLVTASPDSVIQDFQKFFEPPRGHTVPRLGTTRAQRLLAGASGLNCGVLG